jgi:hypothetical protein
MSVWLLALISWLVVFPLLVLAIAFLLATVLRRPEPRPGDAPAADVIPLEPFRRRRVSSIAAAPRRIRSDHPAAPIA